MNTKEIARRLVALCRESQWEKAQRELYAANAVSIEPEESPAFQKETRGLPAILEKGKQFEAMIEEFHGIEVGDPIVTESSFACLMAIDVKMKGQPRMKMSELCVYDVKDGKIVREEFHN